MQWAPVLVSVSLMLFGCTTTHYVMIPATAFHKGSLNNDSWDFDHISSRGAFGAILAGQAPHSVRVYAPVTLPHKATVTELTAYYFDRAPEDISQLDLSLVYQNTGANFGMAKVNVQTTGSANVFQSASDTNISNPVIDAATTRVWLILSMTVTAPSIDLRFYGARIKYTTRWP